MGCGDYLKELLRPLGVYRLEGTAAGAELESEGQALDSVGLTLEELQREMCLATAENWGLEAMEALLTRRPVAAAPERRRAALAALLRIGGDSFTPAAVNDNLKGCGISAVAGEGAEPQTVEVRFPEVPGIPGGFEELRGIIEDILPCHLGVTYVYWYITWAIMEERFTVWGEVEAMDLTWGELEKLVL